MAPQPTTPARTVGTPSGETFNRYADDATGINVPDRKPIDNRMPSMPPA
jgi:hypothetical protein